MNMKRKVRTETTKRIKNLEEPELDGAHEDEEAVVEDDVDIEEDVEEEEG
jgi:hypothetical protein